MCSMVLAFKFFVFFWLIFVNGFFLAKEVSHVILCDNIKQQ